MEEYRYSMVINGETAPHHLHLGKEKMKMFLGEYNPNLTEGSRIALPKKIREQIKGDSIILTRGFEKCIYLYDKEDWEKQSERQVENTKVDAKDTKIRDLERFIYASASEVAIDTQGRIVIPSNLIDYAQINQRLSVVGVGSRVEIWSNELWSGHFEKISQVLLQ